jgi:hypothetical protein
MHGFLIVMNRIPCISDRYRTLWSQCGSGYEPVVKVKMLPYIFPFWSNFKFLTYFYLIRPCLNKFYVIKHTKVGTVSFRSAPDPGRAK